MYDPDHNASPVNPLPPVIIGLAMMITLAELLFQMGARGFAGGPQGVGWRTEAVQMFGFYTPMFDYMLETGDWRAEGIWRFFSYPFVHQGFTHALFAVVILLALGNVVARFFGAFAVLAVFLAAAGAGALTFGILAREDGLLFGAYPAVYGILGMYTWLLWVAADQMGQSRSAAFRLIGVLVGVQLMFVVLGGGMLQLYADVAGFLIGFALSTLVAPGGFSRLRARLRR